MSLILFTGDRNWTDYCIVDRTLRELVVDERSHGRELMIVHGDCPTGLDRICREGCERHGIAEFRCPAKWAARGKAAGPIRNGWMLQLHPVYVMAFHPDIASSKGTKDMVKKAMKQKIECAIYTGKAWLNPYKMVEFA